ncbi:MAG: hypothetical protein JXQ90_09805 [Cyclobacteriaceae bacterium]
MNTAFKSRLFICISLLSSIAMAQTQVEFATTQVQKTNSEVEISFKLNKNIAPEGYQIIKKGKQIIVSASDSTGLMYGGLEVADQIALAGVTTNTSNTPDLAKRGIKFNIPLDARTPSYDDSGDAAQKNIAIMWEWDFWENFLDKMALYRYNTLTLWNPHPFPSMIKMEDYPDVALEDVCVTTLSPAGLENEWGDPGLVSKNVMNNLKVVKKITIDEKIAFWQKVMRHAKHRGIDIYWINWNICPNSVATPVDAYYKNYGINFEKPEQPGKYGITHELDNEKTKKYYREAVKQFLLTYPDVKGIGVTAGEHMPKKWDTINREEWLWDTYGLGILDAKKEQPDRKVDFIHRVWDSDMDQIMKFWGEYPDKFEVSFKYAKARLYSSPNIPFAEKHIASMEQYGLKSWWNLRNDDIFVYRWGDPEYVRSFINQLPGEKHTAAFHMGSDGYVWGKEFISKNEELSGEYEIDKHWFNFMLWGRLGYDNKLSQEYFIKKLENRFAGIDGKQLLNTWQAASKIIPLVNQFHWRDWDHQWSVESSFARPVLGGYRDVFDFVDNRTMQGSNLINPKTFAENGEMEGKISPPQVVAQLKQLAIASIKGAASLRSGANSMELETLLDDILAMAYLGQYYAQKIDAATHLANYQVTKDETWKEKSMASLETGVEHWKDYRAISEKNYRPQMLARVHWLDWSQVFKYVVEDIRAVRQYELE